MPNEMSSFMPVRMVNLEKEESCDGLSSGDSQV
jgi:hypothetical protein